MATTAEPIQLKPIVALLFGAGIVLMGNGLAGVLIPLRADAESFTRLEIGLVGSAYYAGLMTGCLVCPGIVARVGHIRAFAAFTAITTMAPLCHAIWPQVVAWSALRALTGLCFAGLTMVIEGWLNGMASPATRGRVLASYTMINLTVVTVGMQLVGLADPKGFELFSLVAILYSLAAVPVALTHTSAPAAPRRAKLRLGWLFTVSPAAVLGCFFAGIANAGFWTLSPLFARGAGLGLNQVALFLSIAVLAGAATQWPVGLLSDRIGRRAVIAITAAAAAFAGLLLFSAALGGMAHMAILSLAALYGGVAFNIYPLCVAHANDLVHRKRAIEVSSGLLLTFSAGAVIGPAIASTLMLATGTPGLFLHSAIAHGLIAAVMVLRWRLRPSLPAERAEPFVPLPKTTPAVFELDPRTEPQEGTPAAAAPAERRPEPAPIPPA